MKLRLSIISALAAALAVLAGCDSGGKTAFRMAGEDDSLAYVIGMHVGRNLIAMDSTLNVAAVCEGVRDVFAGKAKFTDAEARTFYLRFMNYTMPERVRAYEEQFLADFSRSNRSYARTASGITYSVAVVGDETKMPRNDADTVVIRYVAKHRDGRVLHSSYERGDTLRTALGDMRDGVREAVKLASKGGKIDFWVPSAMAYGAAGDSQAGIAPNETLYYEIELLDIVQGNRYRRNNASPAPKNI